MTQAQVNWLALDTDAPLATVYTLTVTGAAIATTGQSTTLSARKAIQATGAAVTTLGQSVSLIAARSIQASGASVALIGQVTDLTYSGAVGATYSLTVTGAAVAMTGQLASLSSQRLLSVTPAALTYASASTDMLAQRSLQVNSTSVTLTGQSATVSWSHLLQADPESFGIAGQEAGLTRSYLLSAAAGAFALTSQTVGVNATRLLSAGGTPFAFTGQSSLVTYSNYVEPVTATKGRPASDVSNTGWTASTGTDLYAMIDEVAPDALDYISTTALGSIYEAALNPVVYPGGAVQQVKFRASSSTGNSVIVRLRQAGSTVRSVTQVLTDTDTEYSVTLTAPEIAAMTSGALSVQFESA